MKIQQNIKLNDKCTLRIGGIAKFFVEIKAESELKQTIKWAKANSERVHILGAGSNSYFTDEGFDGLVIKMAIAGIDLASEDVDTAILVANAGEIWDDVVAFSVERNLSGIETLSLIPGTVGAAPVQNIGAYGQELSDTLVELKAYDMNSDSFVTLYGDDCHFGYRDSIFKHQKNRYVITEIKLRLNRTWLKPPFYDSLQKLIDERGIETYSPKILRDLVIEIRKSKLPDPAKIPNAGSFFLNPIVENSHLEKLLLQYPNMPSYPLNPDRSKIPAGWLIEQSGLKGYCIGHVCTHDKQALVITTDGQARYREFIGFVAHIQHTVAKKFGVELEQEPEVVI